MTPSAAASPARVRLDLLGRIDLCVWAEACGAVLSQPKRLGLLVLLALRRRGDFVRRDELLGALWPDSHEDRARAALRQALRFLRRKLGAEVIVNRGDAEVRLDPSRFACDALDLQRARDRGDLREAADRARWALRWAPTDEAAARRLISLLARDGNRSGAVAVYEALSERLTGELQLAPSAETDALMLTLGPALTERSVHVRGATRPPGMKAFQMYLDGLERFIRGDWEGALERYRRSVEVEPDYALPRVVGSIPHFQIAEEARRLNRPRLAREVLDGLDPESGELRGWIFYWAERTMAEHLIGDHRQEFAMASRCREIYPTHPMAILFEIRALAVLGRVADVERLTDLALSSPGAQRPHPAELLVEGALELRAHAVPEAGGGAGALDPDDEAARLRTFLERLDGPFLYGAQWFWLAALAAVEGERKEAARLLARAFADGLPTESHIHTDPHLLLLLRGEPRFDMLMRPRG